MYCIRCGQRLPENARFAPPAALPASRDGPRYSAAVTPHSRRPKSQNILTALRNRPILGRVRSCEIGMMWYTG